MSGHAKIIKQNHNLGYNTQTLRIYAENRKPKQCSSQSLLARYRTSDMNKAKKQNAAKRSRFRARDQLIQPAALDGVQAVVNSFRRDDLKRKQTRGNSSRGTSKVRVFKLVQGSSLVEVLPTTTGISVSQLTSDTRVDRAKGNPQQVHISKSPPTRKFSTEVAHRACNISPESHDFGQVVDENPAQGIARDQYQQLLIEQYGFDPLLPENMREMLMVKKFGKKNSPQVENGSQVPNPDMTATCTETLDSPWTFLDSPVDVENYVPKKNERTIIPSCFTESTPKKQIHISPTPRLKVIARKFSRFKKDNIEVRKLKEKIVCMEYDVYEDCNPEPTQTMRAFFCVKNNCDKCEHKGDIPLSAIPPALKHNITEEELKNLSVQEIEIIDSNVPGNKSYIKDLQKIIQKNRAIKAAKDKSCLDLKSMYEMAKRQIPSLDYDFSKTNLLSKAELDEVKQIILKRCKSSAHGINRQFFKTDVSVDSDKLCELLNT